MRNLEHQIQSSFFDYLKWKHPKIYKCTFAIPNGGKRNLITAVNLKREGVKAGVFDVFVAIPTPAAHGLWLEFKAGKNKLTPHQTEFKAIIEANGYKAVTIYGLDHAIEVLGFYLRGTVVT